MTTTPNLGLKKPASSDPIDVSVLNDNADTLDAFAGEVNESLDGKQDTLTFDAAPTEGSTNPVTSGGVKTDQDRQDALEAADRAALVELVDGGAKNSFNLDDAITSAVQYNATSSLQNGDLVVTSTGRYARVSVPFLFSKGTSVFSCDVSGYTVQGGAVNLRFAENSDSSSPLHDAVAVSGDGQVTAEITVDADIQGYVIFYVNTSGTSYQNSATFSDVMICTKAAWDISQEYVPYRPSYDELIARIEALENT